MKSLPRFLVLALLSLTLHLRAQLPLVPIYEAIPPEGHNYIIGLGQNFRSPSLPFNQRIRVFTSNEAYELKYTYSRESNESTFTPEPTGYQKIFDVSPSNLNLSVESIAIDPDPSNNLVYFTGGLASNRLIVFRITPAAVVNNQVMGGLVRIPAGMVIQAENGTNSVGLFYSTPYGVGVDPEGPAENFVPALIYSPDINTQPVTSLPENTFGVGLVTTGVGALALGPDGRLNVMDTGLNRILRFDPRTFEHLDDIELGNATTSGKSFVITVNGFVFTASTVTGGGSIYNYYTGTLVGSYATSTTFGENGFGGKTSMHTAPDGLVFLYSDVTRGIHVFDSNQLIATPPYLSQITFTNNQLQFVLNGTMGSNYVVQSTSNLLNWISLATNAAPFLFIDPSATSTSQQFYRASVAP